jgi:hypothetical protein
MTTTGAAAQTFVCDEPRVAVVRFMVDALPVGQMRAAGKSRAGSDKGLASVGPTSKV